MAPFVSSVAGRVSAWTYLIRFILPPLVEPTSGKFKKSEFLQDFYHKLMKKIWNFDDKSISPYSSSSRDKSTRNSYFLFEFLDAILFCILIFFIVSSIIAALYRFYLLGSDPMRFKSAQESKILIASSSSSPSHRHLNSASKNSSVAAVKVSYISPSNAILNSLKCFNSSAACSGDSNPASVSSQQFGFI